MTMAPPETDKGKVIYQEIRSVLLHDWDPIGVGNVAAAQDEYDEYVRPIYRLLADGATDKQLIDYLYKTETKTMGLTRFRMRRHLRPVVARLHQIDVRI